MSNKAKFNETVQKIMSVLVDACPKCVPINAASQELFGGKWLDGDFETSADEDYMQSCRDWLREEGLIRGDGNYAVTLKGLEFFDALPQCLRTK
ncbi:hypothetical protein [Pseudomonas frederiksbergensis]|uniref:hypothetical protein n=1 Tax=Pseudomonas frederiksbergensis TaxID=104087 RepID=UPI003D1C6CD9